MQLNDISMQFPSISVLQHENWLWNRMRGSNIDFTTANETAKSSILAEDPYMRPLSSVCRMPQPRGAPRPQSLSSAHCHCSRNPEGCENQHSDDITHGIAVTSHCHTTMRPHQPCADTSLQPCPLRPTRQPSADVTNENITAASAWRHGWQAWPPRPAAPEGPGSPTAPCRIPAHLRSSIAPRGGRRPCPGRAAWGRRTSLRHRGAPSPAERWRHHPATPPRCSRRNDSAGGARRSAVPPTITAAPPAPSPTAPLP